MAGDRKLSEVTRNASPVLSDSLVGIGSTEDYQSYITDIAKVIVETYDGSTMAGSSQSVQDAVNDVNDVANSNLAKIGNTTMGTTATTLTGAIKEHNDKLVNATTEHPGFMSIEDKAKLNGIASGAEVNVQPDWNQTTTTADDYIKNKPSIYTQSQVDGLMNDKVDKVTGKALSTNDYTDTDKNKLAGIPADAEANVQSDWSQTTTTADDFIKNKPTLGTAAAKDVGSANGVAGLDASGKVPSSQLPSYVDDVIEGYYYNGAFYSDSSHTTQITGESGKIYVDLSTDTTYRWSGSIYVQISNPIDIDSTLTQQGKAADAKATGDAIALSEKVNTVNSIQPDNNKNVQTVIELTQAQYDALATKDPNVVYYITDGSVDYPTASTIPYDNTDSGLTADTVQGAIDEVQSGIGNTTMGTTATTLTGAIAEHESDISTLNSNLATVEHSSISLSSVITDAAIRCNNIYYNPATKLVTVSIVFASSSGKIPTANNVIGTIPTKYRPSAIVEGVANIVPVSSTNFIDVRVEACRIEPNGNLMLGNYIYGTPAIKFLSFFIVYFAA